MLVIYGATGIIGTYYKGLYGGHAMQRWEMRPPDGQSVLYLISTTSNTYSNPLIHTDTNVDCLMKRLMACREAGVSCFNFVSSWFVYGKSTGLMKENDPCAPQGLYSITKRCAEDLVMDYCSYHGIDWRIFRLGNVYGGPDKSDGQRNALHYVVQRLKDGAPVELVAGIERDYIHIYDTCRAINHLCNHGALNAIYNIGSGLSVPLSYCADYCKNIIGSESVITQRQADASGQALAMALDCSRLFRSGFSPLISLEEGLSDLCTNQRFSTPAHFSMGTKLMQPLTA